MSRRPPLHAEALEDRVNPATYFFQNTASIAIPDSGAATPYPSAITVAGLPGTITNTTATLVDFNHTFPDDVAVLLDGPGADVELMRRAGGGVAGVDPTDAANITYTFADGSPALTDGSPFSPSGTYRPSQFGAAVAYTGPAPAGPYAAALGALIGTNPNGTWNLFAFDDTGGDSGSFAGGWRLAVTTNTGTDFTYNFATNPGVSAFLGVNGANYVITSINDRVLASQPVVGTTSITLTGRDGAADSFVVFYSGGPITVPVSFDGGSGAGNDTLSLQEFSGGAVTVTHTGAAGGTVQVGAGSSPITFSQTESLAIAAAATDLTINLPPGPNTDVVIGDDTVANFPGLGIGLAGRSALDASTFTYTEFRNPTNSLTVNLGNGGDTISMRAMDAAFAPAGVGGAALTPFVVDGGSADDTINVRATTAGIITLVFGDAGTDTINVSSDAPANGGNLNAIDGVLRTLSGSGPDVLNISQSGLATSDIVTVNTGTGFGPITGTAGGGWTIEDFGIFTGGVNLFTGTAGDTINVLNTFAGEPVNINAGGGSDVITFADGATLSGTVDGGTGTDTIDYTPYTTPVAVNLGLGSNGLGASFDGTQENPGTASTATGTATITNYNILAKTFDISITMSNLTPAQVTGFHIHRGAVGVNGPIIIDLTGATRTPAGTGFTVNLTGVSLATSLLGGVANEAAFLGGQTYFNFHTAADPGGAIRGQIFTNANAQFLFGTATGTGGVSNVENATGGSAADSLVGSFAVNALNGLAGNDTLVGGPGNDMVLGGANDDVLIWNNGDNTDTLDGEAGNDTVAVNGSVTIGDTFTVGANGTRIAFARTNLVPFTLDIGTAETLRVVGVGGDDTTTVNDLTGVANLSTVNLFGLGGNDTFNLNGYAPAGVAVTVNGNGHTTGDTLNFDALGGTAIVTPTTIGNGTQAISYTQIETVNVTNATNNLPTVSDIPNQGASASGVPVGPVGFTVGDLETAATALTLTAGSSNPALVPVANVTFGGSGSNRTVTVAPVAGQSGTATITVTVTDGGGGTASDTFTVTVTPPPSAARNLAVGGATDGSVQVISFAGGVTTVSPFGNTGTTTRTASADVNGDNTADLVVVTGPGTPLRVAVLSGVDGSVLVAPFDPFGGDFTGGGYVAAGDLDGDGRAEFVVTPDQGGGPRVTVFSRNADGTSAVRANFLGIDDVNFRGGARAALGDVNGDGTRDVVVAAGFGGGPRTAIFTGQSVLAGAPTRLVGDFFAFPGTDATNLRNGSFVAAGDVTGDGFADLIFGGGPGGAPRVFILSGALVSAGDVGGAQTAPVANFFVAGNANDRGGVRVAVVNADGDGRADVAAGSGEGSPAKVRVYLGANFAGGAEPGTFQDISVFGGGALPGGVFVG